MAFKVIKENILKVNDDIAGEIRSGMRADGVFMMNIISSPGAGKTSFLERIGPRMKEAGIKFLLITGDCFTTRDAERLDALDLPAVQINTGNACHIDAQLVKSSLKDVDLAEADLIVVENVGNLVCPAEFDLGEDAKIAFLSTAEGHDKPVKYPLLVQESELAIINKTDLIGHVDFDMEFSKDSIKAINPDISIMEMSCKTGEGIDVFMDWIKKKIKNKKEICA